MGNTLPLTLHQNPSFLISACNQECWSMQSLRLWNTLREARGGTCDFMEHGKGKQVKLMEFYLEISLEVWVHKECKIRAFVYT